MTAVHLFYRITLIGVQTAVQSSFEVTLHLLQPVTMAPFVDH